MEIVVSDTNIFIDFIKIGMLDRMFGLPFRFHTVDSIIAEITNESQRQEVLQVVSEGRLHVHELDEQENMEVAMMYINNYNNASVQDCSVWYYAKKYDYRLLTGDKKLRLSASSDGVLVSGILFLFDKMLECSADKDFIISKILELCKYNKRLPNKLVDELISKYKSR